MGGTTTIPGLNIKARGVDVTAEEALDGGLGGFGGCDCVGHTVPLLWGVPPPEIHKIFKIR